MSVEFDKELFTLIQRIKLIVFDFDGVFTNNSVYVLEDGREMIRCNRGDGLGIGKLEKIGVDKIVISTEVNPVVVARTKKLKIECFHGVADKLAVLKECVKARGITLQETAYVGNDLNDLSCLQAVGLAIVVADAHPDVLPVGRYCTRATGGNGAVREICDLFEKVRT